MNALKSLDVYLSPPSGSRPPSKTTTPAGSPVRTSIKLRDLLDAPESILNSPEPVSSKSTVDDSSPSDQARGRMRRRPTPIPPASTKGSQKKKKKRRVGATSGSDDTKATRRKRKRLQRSEGWLGGAYIAVVALWASLWGTVFGDTEGFLRSMKEATDAANNVEKLPALRQEKDVPEGSASESEISEKGGAYPAWEDPVTRAPADEEELVLQAETADVPPPVQAEERAAFGSSQRITPDAISFQLRSSSGDRGALQKYQAVAIVDGRQVGILTNSTSSVDDAMVEVTTPSGRRTKLLPNPFAPTLLTTGAKETDNAQTKTITGSTFVNRPIPIPRAPLMTPFHLPKTLILDLDETLIHSTSRAMSIQSSGVGGGSGLVGINLSGLFGSQRRGGGGARGEGHTVEVVLGGRSTLYHVYKRPFVDHFLKKVRFRGRSFFVSQYSTLASDEQVSSWYTLVIFTASMQEYADPVIDWLDGGRGLFGKKLYRDVSLAKYDMTYRLDSADLFLTDSPAHCNPMAHTSKI